MSDRFFTHINYSASNEDSASELSALKITDSDQVVCISGSGARSLDLLIANPQTIYSVDFNPSQNHLLNLKIAAFRALEYEQFVQFMGLPNSKQTSKQTSQQDAQVLEKVKTSLAAESQEFWAKNQNLIQRGLLYCGTWEKLLAWISKATILRRRHVAGLLDAPDLESQTEYWQKHWSGSFFKNFLKLAFNRFLWTTIIREPGAKLIPIDFDPAEYLRGCIENMAHHSLLRENPYANLLFYGKYTDQCELPIHLRPQNFETIKSRVDRIKVITAPLNEYLVQHPNQFDAYSLSDFSSYAPPELYHSIWNAVVSSANENARFCERFFMVKMNQILQDNQTNRRREQWESCVVADKQLEQELQRSDHTCLYSFHVGAISK